MATIRGYDFRAFVYNREKDIEDFEPVVGSFNETNMIEQYTLLFKNRKVVENLRHQAIFRHPPYIPFILQLGIYNNIYAIIENNDNKIEAIREMLNNASELKQNIITKIKFQRYSLTIRLSKLLNDIHVKLLALHNALSSSESRLAEEVSRVHRFENLLHRVAQRDHSELKQFSDSLSNANMEIENVSQHTFVPQLFLEDLRLRNSALLSKYYYRDLITATNRPEELRKELEIKLNNDMKRNRLDADSQIKHLNLEEQNQEVIMENYDIKIDDNEATIRKQNCEIKSLHELNIHPNISPTELLKQFTILMAQGYNRSELRTTNTLQSTDNSAVPAFTTSRTATTEASYTSSSSSSKNHPRKRSRVDKLPDSTSTSTSTSNTSYPSLRAVEVVKRVVEAFAEYREGTQPTTTPSDEIPKPPLVSEMGKSKPRKYKGYRYEAVAKKGKDSLINKHVMKEFEGGYYEGKINAYSVGIWDYYVIDYGNNVQETLDINDVLDILVD